MCFTFFLIYGNGLRNASEIWAQLGWVEWLIHATGREKVGYEPEDRCPTMYAGRVEEAAWA
jgi:hypothetical protein